MVGERDVTRAETHAADPSGRSGSVAIIARPGIATGFALAGTRCRIVEDAAAAASEVEHVLSSSSGSDGGAGGADDSVAVLLIESDLYERLPESTKRRLVRRTLPLVVPFPGPAEAVPGTSKDFVAELLRRAIGYRVRLR